MVAEEGIQHLIHHPLIPTPTLSFAGSAEGPNIAVAPVLAPAGFVALHHGTGADLLEHLSHRRLSLTGYSMDGRWLPMDGLQVPLDDSYGQPSLLPQGHHQAYQIDPQALLAQPPPAGPLWAAGAAGIPDRCGLPGRARSLLPNR